MFFAAYTDMGEVRKENQDCFYIPENSDDVKLFLIADGIGGQCHGKLAAQLTVDTIQKCMKEYKDKADEIALSKAATEANKRIYELSQNELEYQGMGTTLIALLINEGHANIIHAGDSRCYLIRNKIISQLTIDNSYVEYLLQKGAISTQEAKFHPQKNLITKAIGMEENIEIESDSTEIKSGDIFLLCSDGLTSMLNDEYILNIINNTDDIAASADLLIKEAKKSGGTDNITVILVKV